MEKMGLRNLRELFNTTITIDSSVYALVASTTDDGVQIIDITDPENITPVDAVTDGKDGFDELNGASDITTVKIGSSFYALVASFDDDGIQIINITDPENIVPADSATNGRGGFDKLGGAHRITTVALGQSVYALVASFKGDSVQIIDITDPENITPVDLAVDGKEGFDELDGATGITAVKIGSATYVLVVSYDDDGIQIIEIKEPKGYNLKLFDSLEINDSVKASVSKSVNISDGLVISDSVKDGLNKDASISDGLVISDSVSVTKMQAASQPVNENPLSILNINVITNRNGEFGFTITPENNMQNAIQHTVSIVRGVYGQPAINLPAGTYTVTLTSVPENFTLESITCRVIQERYQNTFTIQTELDELGTPVIAYCTVHVNFTISTALSDSIGIDDSVSVTKTEFVVEPKRYSVELSDSIEIIDSIEVIKTEFVAEPKNYNLQLDDNLRISDSVKVTKIKAIPDPVHHNLELSDSIGISDSVETTKIERVSEPKRYNIQLDDTLEIDDSVSVTKTEFIPEPKSYNLELSDSIGISDSVEITKIEFIPTPKIYSLELADGLEINDSVKVTKIEFVPEPKNYNLQLADSLGISDSVNVIKIEFIPEPKIYSLELSDSIGISDSVKVTTIKDIPEPKRYSLLLIENLEISEYLEIAKMEFIPTPKSYSLKLDDGLEIIDSVEITKIEMIPTPKKYSLELADNLGIADSVSVIKTSTTPEPINHNLLLADNLGITDNIKTTKIESVSTPTPQPAPIPASPDEIVTAPTLNNLPMTLGSGTGGSGTGGGSGSRIGFTTSSNLIVWNYCSNTENYTILIASTYGDNLYSQIKSSESSYNGIDVTAETDFKKYIANTRIPINFYAFSFNGIEQSDVYEIAVYDKSKRFVPSKVSIESCAGSVIIHEPRGVVLKNYNSNANVLDEKVSYEEKIITLCDAHKDKSIITKASTGKLYCVFNSSVEKLIERGWAE